MSCSLRTSSCLSPKSMVCKSIVTPICCGTVYSLQTQSLQCLWMWFWRKHPHLFLLLSQSWLLSKSAVQNRWRRRVLWQTEQRRIQSHARELRLQPAEWEVHHAEPERPSGILPGEGALAGGCQCQFGEADPRVLWEERADLPEGLQRLLEHHQLPEGRGTPGTFLRDGMMENIYSMHYINIFISMFYIVDWSCYLQQCQHPPADRQL